MNGYGPQLGDQKERKYSFWNYLDKEVLEAEEEQIGIVIQMDSNCWAGHELIPNDPNSQNANGKLLELFLRRNKGIHLVNSLELCEGTITRKRLTENRKEQAAMDLFLVSQNMLSMVVKKHVDEQGEHQQTPKSIPHASRAHTLFRTKSGCGKRI